MEIVLNLCWVLLAFVIVRLWVVYAPCAGTSRRTQVAALALLIIILFPVISVTDDLQALRNPAEVDCRARRNHAAACIHSTSTAVAGPPAAIFIASSSDFRRFIPPAGFSVRVVANAALAPIQNRPPPAD
jgi:hypothetical protein